MNCLIKTSGYALRVTWIRSNPCYFLFLEKEKSFLIFFLWAVTPPKIVMNFHRNYENHISSVVSGRQHKTLNSLKRFMKIDFSLFFRYLWLNFIKYIDKYRWNFKYVPFPSSSQHVGQRYLIFLILLSYRSCQHFRISYFVWTFHQLISLIFETRCNDVTHVHFVNSCVFFYGRKNAKQFCAF